MREFSVRIVLSELTIVADSAERAEEIAVGILDSDARTRLSHGLCVEACEVGERGPSDEEETEASDDWPEEATGDFSKRTVVRTSGRRKEDGRAAERPTAVRRRSGGNTGRKRADRDWEDTLALPRNSSL